MFKAESYKRANKFTNKLNRVGFVLSLFIIIINNNKIGKYFVLYVFAREWMFEGSSNRFHRRGCPEEYRRNTWWRYSEFRLKSNKEQFTITELIMIALFLFFLSFILIIIRRNSGTLYCCTFHNEIYHTI